MQVTQLRLSGLQLITPALFPDERGLFFESYRQPLYVACGVREQFVQDNFSLSRQGTLRGLHYQSHPGQAKLVSCIRGSIWDVVVDLRPESATFGQWEAVELDDKTCRQLYIPIGFAHGFCVLSKEAWVHYKVSAVYDPQAECSLRWNDPHLRIEWPIAHPHLSPRDQASPFFAEVLR